jgi:hypothetical protein
VVAVNSIWSNVEQAIYFRKNGLTYYYLNSITVPNDYGDGRYIPPMQGFFIKSNLNNVSLTIPTTAKIHTSHARYKSGSIIPMVRLQVENSDKSDQAVIRLDENATMNFDNSFDARKIYPATGYPYIAASMNGTDLAIDGIPFPEDTTEILLTFIAPASGSYIFSARELSGLDNYLIYLKDKDQNLIQALFSSSSYNFSSTQGKFTDRFSIIFTKSTTSGINNTEFQTNDFQVFIANGMLNINTLDISAASKTGDIRVFDLMGRTFLMIRKHEFINGELLKIPFNYPKGLYIIEISVPGNRFVGKLIMRR